MSRLACIAVVAALTSLIGAAGASACILQGGSIGPVDGDGNTPVHPGDAMRFTVSRLDVGAEYTVTVGGRRIAKATKTDGPGQIVRTFTLEDYGPSPRNIAISIHLFHQGAGTDHEDTIDNFLEIGRATLSYVPAPVAQPQPETPTPAGQATTPGSTSGAAPQATPTGPPANARPSVPVPLTPRAGVVRDSHRASAPNHLLARGAAPVTKPARVARPFIVQAAPTDAPAPTLRVATARPSTHRTARVRGAVPTAARHGVPITARKRIGEGQVTPAVALREARPGVVVRARSAGPAAISAALLALMVFAGGGLGWLAWRRRSLDHPLDTAVALAIEAELQEIIAEHRAADAAHPPPTRVPG